MRFAICRALVKRLTVAMPTDDYKSQRRAQLPGAMKLTQMPMIAGASYTARSYLGDTRPLDVRNTAESILQIDADCLALPCLRISSDS